MTQYTEQIARQYAQGAINYITWKDVIVNVKDPAYGARGDGVYDDTAAFASASAVGGLVVVPPTDKYYKVSSSIQLTNSIIGFGMPEIRMVGADGSESKKMFVVEGYYGAGLSISGLHLNGGWNGIGNLGEQSHLVRITNSQNVYVHDNNFEYPYGDCVYIGSNTVANSNNIHVFKNTMTNPYRCCVAVVGAKNVWIQDNNMKDNSQYVACIDVEPNTSTVDDIDGLWILNNKFDVDNYFVNLYNPNAARNVRNVTISGNKGSARYVIRALNSVGVCENVTVEDNEYYGGYGDQRFANIGRIINGLVMRRNKDFSTGASGWSITGATNPIVTDNIMRASRAVGVQFVNCQKVLCARNTTQDVYSSSGAIIFSGTDATAQSGHMIHNNQLINADYGIVFTGVSFTDCLFDDNYIQSNRRSVNFASSATGSKVVITAANVFTGTATGVFGDTYNNNINKGYKTAITAAPDFIGQLAIVGAVSYTAVGTAATSDWKQTSN